MTALALAASTLVAVERAVAGASSMSVAYGHVYSHPVIASISLASVAAVALAASVRRIPLPPGLVLALGGLTYPLYLLHQNIGYIAFNQFGGLVAPEALVLGVTAVVVAAAWAVWRYVEHPGTRLCRRMLTSASERALRASVLCSAVAVGRRIWRGGSKQGRRPEVVAVSEVASATGSSVPHSHAHPTE